MAWEGFFRRKAEKKKAMLIPHAIFRAFGVGETEVLECVEMSLQCVKDNLIKTLCGIMGTFTILFDFDFVVSLHFGCL